MAKLRCEQHPGYRGRAKPLKQCGGCLKLYLALTTPRAPIVPTKVFKDPSVYNRKEKHKTHLDED